MILIVGSSKDDILYFDTILKNKTNCAPLYDVFPTIKGTIFNQNIMIVYGIYTSYISSAIIDSIIKEYNPLLVIMVGKCKAVSPELKVGDIALLKNAYAIDADQREYKNVKTAQIPSFDQEYAPSIDLINILNKSFDMFYINKTIEATFLCTNSLSIAPTLVNDLNVEGTILGHSKNIVLDCESFGAIVPCKLNGIPFIAIKVVDSYVGKISCIENFVKTMKSYSLVGKALVSFIGEIGRRDLMD